MGNAIQGILRYALPRWLVGPILDKELRVSSRRRRNYVVRAVYLGLLTVFVTLDWLTNVPHGRSSASRGAAMAAAGMEITFVIGWFQFLVCQALAVVMLSSAISDEVYNRTLGVLMTTPINSLQIVVGKLASRLLQVVLLAAMSLPLLAIVRVFGGIAWVFLTGVWVLTLTATLFAGSVSLLFSIFCRRAYTAILWAAMSLAGLWGAVPLLTGLIGVEYHLISNHQWERFCALTNPFFSLAQLTEWLVSPRAVPSGIYSVWLWPSLVTLACATGVLTIAVVRVRVVARRQITGEVLPPTGRSRRAGSRAKAAALRPVAVCGCPVLWKERRAPLLGRRRWVKVLGAILVLASLALVYGVAADERALKDSDFHMGMVFVYMLLGGLFTTVFPATTITTEKESRSWPILLGTTLGDWRIVLAKGLGAIRRSLLAWGFLVVHTVGFAIAGILHPVCLVHLAIAATGLVAFVTGTGLYFSSRFKHTTSAVIANLSVPVVIWGLVPIVLAIVLEIGHQGDRFLEVYLSTCPFAQAIIIMDHAARGSALQMVRFGNYSLDMGEATVFLLMTTAVYVLLGFVFAGCAKRNLRKRVF